MAEPLDPPTSWPRHLQASWPVAADAKLVITSAVVDLEADTITVFGDSSDKKPLVVTLDGVPLELLRTYRSEIVAFLPDEVAAGAHRVAVCRVDDNEEDRRRGRRHKKDDDKGCPEKG